MTDFFFTLPIQKPGIAFEYYADRDDFACDYIAPANPELFKYIPQDKLEGFMKLVELGKGMYPQAMSTGLEFDLVNVENGELGAPGIFMLLGHPEHTVKIMEVLCELVDVKDVVLPELPAGARYSHVGAFLGRNRPVLRMIVDGSDASLKQFVIEQGGNTTWFDKVEKYSTYLTVAFDLLDNEVHNIRLEVHIPANGDVPGLTNTKWAKSVIKDFTANVKKYYADNMPDFYGMMHFKVGANDTDVKNKYCKLYTQCVWSK